MNAQLRESPPMNERLAPYSQKRVDEILEELHQLVPDMAAVRTDRFHGAELSQSNPQRILIEHGAGKKFRMGVPALLVGAPTGHIRSNLNLTARDAELVLKCCSELVSLNPMGAWCVTPSPMEPLVVNIHSAGGNPIQRDSYLSETCDILAENLPNVGAIEIDYRITGNTGGASIQRRRAFLRFVAKNGIHEVAAIDTAGIALHARHQILKPRDEEMLELNLWRMQFWADTLGTTPDNLAEVFPTLVFLNSALHVTRIDLP